MLALYVQLVVFNQLDQGRRSVRRIKSLQKRKGVGRTKKLHTI